MFLSSPYCHRLHLNEEDFGEEIAVATDDDGIVVPGPHTWLRLDALPGAMLVRLGWLGASRMSFQSGRA